MWWSVPDYWAINDEELEKLAHKNNIRGYVDPGSSPDPRMATGPATINRKLIIDQLLTRDNARFASFTRLGMFVSLAGAITSIVAVIINIAG